MSRETVMRRLVFFSLALFALFFSGPTVSAQAVGQNINMVSGTSFPGGDPYLQRQNEPSMAVSTRNPEHLMAGANDYRSVDIPDPQSVDETHDAWLGVFTSLDGGETWKSTLLPGYPQDNSTVGKASPLHNFTVATDPTVRAGTHGLFYYSGLVFNRGTKAASGVFVATLQDQNNKGNGNAAIQQQKGGKGNPFLYLNANLLESGTSGQFLDKPWIAVDVPRPGRTAICNINGQTIQSGYVYVFYTSFTGHSTSNPHSKIQTATSTDCGATWSHPQTLSQTLKLSQGTVAAIDPGTGTVYVAWRQEAIKGQPDSIQYAYSNDGGSSFVSQPPAYTFPTGSAFDQPSGSSNTFRTIDVPALAVDASGRVWLAFSQRVNGPNGTFGSRIMLSTLARNGTVWTTPYAADATTTTTGGLPEGPPVWHQFMPSLSFAYGKLMLIYYDSRWDNQMSVLRCPANTSCNNLSQLTLHHQPIPGSALGSKAPLNFAGVFGTSISDPVPGIRHEIDVFGAMIDPTQYNGSPLRGQSFPISQYAFWENPNDGHQIEQGYFNTPDLPLFVQGHVPFIGDYIEVAGLSMLPGPNGTWSFNSQSKDAPVFHATWTDNRDVVPPPCVPFNGDASRCTEDWTQYIPPNGGFSLSSTYSSGTSSCPTCVTTQPACTLSNSGYSGDRNQNIYTSLITNGLLVRFRENQKPVASKQRAFSLLVRNTVSPLSTNPLGAPSHYRVMLGVTATNQMPTCTISGGTATLPSPAGGCVPFLDVDINPRTTVTRTINVNSTVANPSVNVLVAQIQNIPAPGTNPVFLGLQASAVLNADPSNTGLADPDSVSADNSNPDLSTPYGNITLSTGEVYDPTVDGPGINAPGINSPGINAPGINSPSINAPGINAPGITNAANNAPGINSPGIVTVATNAPGITSVSTVNPTVTVAANAPGINAPGINAPGINAPGINAPGIVNPDYFAPSITNLQDGQVTDYTWRATNKGNTSSSYNAKEFAKTSGVVCCDGSGNPSGCSKCQLIVHKVYNSPTSNRDTSGNLTCDLTVQQQSITVANIPNPSAFTTQGGAAGDGSANNPSLSLAPGEGNRLTLRVQAPLVVPKTQVFPFKALALGFTKDFNGGSAASLLVSTTGLPVAVVGQNYVGAPLQSIGGTGITAWSVPTSLTNPVPAPLPTGPAPLPVAPLTLIQNGQISQGIITSAPGAYSNVNVQVQDSATTNSLSTPALDLQQLTMNVNRFSLSSITAANSSTNSIYLKGGDSATITVTVDNEGPATASGVVPTISVNPIAAGGGPTPVVNCAAPNPASLDIAGGQQQAFIFTCAVPASGGGNGQVTFTANATTTYNSNGAVPVSASTSFQPQPASPQMIVDTTPPTLNLVSVTTPGPQNYVTGNWANQSVTVNYSCSDNLSGVASGSPSITVVNPSGPLGTITVVDALHSTAKVTASAESANTAVSSACQDVAGNIATPPTAVSPIMIDKTKPTIAVSAVAGTSPYAAGSWTNQNVTVTYTCTDNLSGPFSTHPVITGLPTGVVPVIAQVTSLISTAKATLTAETAGTTLSASCTDNATNPGTGLAFGPIMIDKTAPVLSYGVSPQPNAAGWNNTKPVTVAYSCVDNASAVANSGVLPGSVTAPQVFNNEGSTNTSGSCTDVAGNMVSIPATVNIDSVPPAITSSVSPAPSAAGWNNTVPVTVTFACTDGPPGSGPKTFTPPVQLNSDGAAQVVNGSCTDVADNIATNKATVNIDTTPPTVTGTATAGGTPYTAGTWTNQSPVIVTFTCNDALSGPAPGSTTGNAVFSGQTSPTSVQGSCMDIAGNTSDPAASSSTFGPVQIDQVAPSIAITTPAPGQMFLLNSQITPVYTCAEGAGGVDSATCTATPSASPFTAAAVGPATFSVSAVDQAQNTSSASSNYLVTYNFTGFQAPLQAAGPSTAPSNSGGFALGSTLPIAWTLTDGSTPPVAITDPSTLAGIVAIPNPACTGTVQGTGIALFPITQPSTNSFSYDSTRGAFVFNWDTSTLQGVGGCFNIVITLNDTTSYATIVSLHFAGFASPLAVAGPPSAPSNSGSVANLEVGNTVPVSWQLQDSSGNVLTTDTFAASGSIQAFANSACSGAPPQNAAATTLFSNGAAVGTSTYSFDNTKDEYTLGWDVSSLTAGTCYNLVLTLPDGSSYATIVHN